MLVCILLVLAAAARELTGARVVLPQGGVVLQASYIVKGGWEKCFLLYTLRSSTFSLAVAVIKKCIKSLTILMANSQSSPP